MIFRLSAVLVAILSLLASGGQAGVLGTVQREIRLSDGTVFTQAKILDYSAAKGTATIAGSNRIRTVPLKNLPAPLREQLLAEGEPRDDRRRIYHRPESSRPAPPPDQVILPSPLVATGASTSPLDQLLEQATAEAADELKFYLLRAFDRVASVTCKVRKVEQVPGWQKIRVSGDAAFSKWDGSRRDYVWHTDKFEVEFEIVDGKSLKPDTVSFGGISRAVETD